MASSRTPRWLERGDAEYPRSWTRTVLHAAMVRLVNELLLMQTWAQEQDWSTVYPGSGKEELLRVVDGARGAVEDFNTWVGEVSRRRARRRLPH